MDGLSSAASVIAVVQISVKVVSLCLTYCLKVKDAKDDIRRLRDEVMSLGNVLTNIADLADAPGSTKLSTLDLLNQPGGPVQQCRTELVGLATKLESGQEEGGMKKFGLRALKWPFSSKDIDKVIAVIGRHKSTFTLALTADQTALALAIGQSVAELRQQSVATRTDITATRADVAATRTGIEATQADMAAHRIDENLNKITEWLSTTDPSSNHHAACRKRQPTTGEWFIERADFEEWKGVRNSLLWLYGIPGCGKTILSSTIIEHMKAYCDSKPNLAVAYFYFDFNDTDKQNAANYVSSLIAQLCSQVVNLPEKLKELYKRCNNGNQKAAVYDLKSVLALFAEMKELDIFIVADALDECPKGREKGFREELLELIAEVKAWPISNIHLLVTSRPEPDIGEKLTPILTTKVISIQGSEVESDIKLHISSQLSTDPKLRRWSSEVKEEIEKTLVVGARGMFRWVFCQLDALKKCLKASAIRKALKSLPKTLDDTYERILTSIDEDYRQEARNALLWLAFSKRPLLVKEVAEAAVVNPQSDPPFDPEDRLADSNSILEILGSLVTISVRGIVGVGSDSVTGDLDDCSDRWLSRTIRLAHFSVKEYLVSERIQCGKASEFGAAEVVGNHFIMKSCLLYIFHYAESDSKTTSYKDLESLPLLEYACQFWCIHVDKQKPIDPAIRQLFLSNTAFMSWLRFYHIYPMGNRFEIPNDIGAPLYYASGIGIREVVQLLLGKGVDVNARRSDGRTALHKGASGGHEAIVQLLLEQGADVNAKENDGQTSLYIAASRGHKAVVQLLLEQGADANARESIGRTALHIAAIRGYKAVVQLLLEQGADVNARDDGGSAALHVAATSGHKAVVQLLLEQGADANARENIGRTALYCAAFAGYEAIVQLLFEQGVDINVKAKDGGTALQRAAHYGHEAVVQLLLEQGADVNVKQDNGQTALHLAAYGGHKDVVQLLLGQGADADAEDNDGRTAMYLAASEGHKTIVQLLLEQEADVNAKDDDGWTALHIAAVDGYKDVVQLLLEQGVDVNAKENDGQTALHIAASGGHKNVVQLLLEQGADVNVEDNYSQTAMDIATKGVLS